METIQNIFNNREIALLIWGTVAIIMFLFFRHAREFIKKAISILSSKKFLIMYIVFISYLLIILYVLKWSGIWSLELLKDTVFWVIFVELPLFARTIEKADGGRFFCKLIQENIAVAVIIEFIIGFWTFGLVIELILVPVTVLFSALYALAEQEKKYSSVKRFFEGMLGIWGSFLLIYGIYNIICFPGEFFKCETLKSFLLPIILLICHFPIIYGLALYNMYEQVYVRINGDSKEQYKMKWQIFHFAGIRLSKIVAIKKNLPTTVVFCKTSLELKMNLERLSKRLDLQVGDNYMKRSHYYIKACVIGFLISLFGLLGANSEVPFKDIITLNFVVDIPRLKEILTYIFSSSIVFSLVLLIYAIGFNKKQREDITQIKKYALFELLSEAKRQEIQITEYLPIDDPVKLYECYVHNVYKIRVSCDKVLNAYENLLTTWEQETVKLLKSSATVLSDDFGIRVDNAEKYTVELFCDYYKEQKKIAPQNEQFNNYTYNVKRDLEKYITKVKQFCDDFKYCYQT